MDFVEVKPIKPFVGSYPCSFADADTVDDVLVDKPDGTVVKERVPRKRFVGLISVERDASLNELVLINTGTVPPELEVLFVDKTKAEARVLAHPAQRTVKVPADIADNLFERGLAERVATIAKKGK